MRHWALLALLFGLTTGCGGGGGVAPNPTPTCDLSMEEQRLFAQALIVERYADSVSTCSFADTSCEDLAAALQWLRIVTGLDANYDMFAFENADGFNAFALPGNTMVFHYDAWLMAEAVAYAFECYALGLPIEGIAPPYDVPTGNLADFRQVVIALVNFIEFDHGQSAYWLPDTVEGQHIAVEILAGLAAHEEAHVLNNDVEDSYCRDQLGVDPFEIAVYKLEQERQADIDGARYLATGVKAYPDGYLQPRGILLLAEILIAEETIFGLGDLTHPPAIQRLQNVQLELQNQGVQSSLAFTF